MGQALRRCRLKFVLNFCGELTCGFFEIIITIGVMILPGNKMNKKLKVLLSDVENELKSIFREKLMNIILYGSYARGDYDEESDIDIIALVEEDGLKRYNDKVVELEIDITIKYGLMPSILLENKEYFNKNRKRECLFDSVLRDGKTIYAA
jgi:uncharacterized protein